MTIMVPLLMYAALDLEGCFDLMVLCFQASLEKELWF